MIVLTYVAEVKEEWMWGKLTTVILTSTCGEFALRQSFVSVNFIYNLYFFAKHFKDIHVFSQTRLIKSVYDKIQLEKCENLKYSQD